WFTYLCVSGVRCRNTAPSIHFLWRLRRPQHHGTARELHHCPATKWHRGESQLGDWPHVRLVQVSRCLQQGSRLVPRRPQPRRSDQCPCYQWQPEARRGCKELRLFSQRRILRTNRKRFEGKNTRCHPCTGGAWRSSKQYQHRQAVFARRDKGSRLKSTPCTQVRCK